MAVPVATLALPDAGQDGVAGIDVAQNHDLLLREVEAGQGAPAQGRILKRDEQAPDGTAGHLRPAAGGADSAAQPLQAHACVGDVDGGLVVPDDGRVDALLGLAPESLGLGAVDHGLKAVPHRLAGGPGHIGHHLRADGGSQREPLEANHIDV